MKEDQNWMLEPWEFTGNWPEDGRDDVDLVVSASGVVLSQSDWEGYSIDRKDMARAIVCVNSCAGLSLPSSVPLGALKEVVEALQEVTDSWKTIYNGEWDEIGEKSCCGVVSYKPHAPDCFVAKAMKALDQLQETHSAEKGEA